MIDIKNLTIEYDHHQVFSNLNLEIPENSMIVMVGPNGAGKSTLLKAIADLNKHDLTYIEQRPSFNFDFPITIKEMVATGLINNFNPIDIEEALKQVDILDLANQQISQLSGGQLQRGLIARAIVHNKATWLLDESLSGIDQATQKIILEILKNKVEQEKKTIILSSHDLNQIKDFFDYAIVLDTNGNVEVNQL